MGLIAWWPLNGDLKDYSNNNNDMVAINAFNISNDGKIGKCYASTANNAHGSSSKEVLLTGSHTMCLWFNLSAYSSSPTAIFTNHLYASTANTGINLVGNKIGVSIGYTDSSREWDLRKGTTTIELNKWYHVAMVYNKKNNALNIYVNGIKEYSGVLTKTIKFMSAKLQLNQWSVGSGSYTTTGKYNDVRVYNEALSAKDIKEIAKAKILHYDFNQFKESYKNIITNPKYEDKTYGTAYAASSWGGDAGTITYYGSGGYNNLPYKKVTKTVSGTGGIYIKSHSITIEANKTYTFSCYIRADKNFTASNYSFNINRSTDNYYITHDGSLNITNEWKLFSKTFTATIAQAGVYGETSIVYDDSVPINVYYSGFNIVESEYAKPFVNGIKIDRIYDSSGFKNHSNPLDLINSPQWIKDSSLGSGCYRFSGNNSITAKQLFFDHVNQEWTITGWVKLNVNNTSQYIDNFNLGNRLTHGTTQKALLYANDATQDHYVYSSTQMPINEWYHFAFVYSTEKKICKYYHNGILNAASSNYETSDYPQGFSVVTILGQFLNGYLADVRIYATALSDEDIKELYEVKANITKDGKFIINTLVELPNLAYLMNKALKAKLFHNGLSSYIQSNCTVTLTNDGYRIFRPPNLTPQANGNTMWGGLKLNFKDDVFVKGHKYKFSFLANGVSSNAMNAPYLTPQMGWCAGGLTMKYATQSNIIPANFNSLTFQKFYAIFDLTGFDVYQTATKTESIFELGKAYNCCKDLAFGFSYTATGALGTDLYLKNFELVDITDNTLSINKKSQFICQTVNEIGAKIRYVRDYINGSTANTGNHWCELKVMFDDINLAKNLPVTGSVSISNAQIMTNDVVDANYASCGPGLQYVQIDLGSVQQVDYIHVWHYYQDDRIYHDTKTQVSVDGIDWLTIYDSAVDGKYVETSLGKKMHIIPFQLSIAKDGNIFVNEIIENL